MGKLLAFLKRDFLVEASYRFPFVFQVAWTLFSIASYAFMARFIGSATLPALGAYGGDYFAFVVVGVALHDYFMTAMDAFSRSIRDAQLAGTLEALLATQTSLPTIIFASAAYPFLWRSFNVVLYLAIGVGFFNLHLVPENWAAAALTLILSVVAFSGLGILSASFTMVFKRGSPIVLLFGGLSWLLGGVFYPVTVMPAWLQRVSALLPITYAIEGMRACLLGAGRWSDLWGSLGPLMLFACVVFPLSLVSFHYATRHARMTGTLAQY
jgi:ABC-2 type transport system permease protein